LRASGLRSNQRRFHVMRWWRQYRRSIGVDQATHAAACTTMKIVDPNNADPMQSSLYLKLICVPQVAPMPKGRPALTADKLDLFARWIAGGRR